MDIARPSNAKKKRIKQAIYAGVGLLAVVLVSVGLSRLKPAAPTVERAVVWPAKVERGPMVRQVRGLGTLTPEDIRWIPATTQGRVEKIILRPGTQVKSGDVILELTNPQLEQQLQDRGVPRRLVLDFAFLEPEFVAECLADGILFSTERGCWRLS